MPTQTNDSHARIVDKDGEREMRPVRTDSLRRIAEETVA